MREKTQELRVQVFVRDNNVDQALKALKRKMQREGVFREMKLRKHYEKPQEESPRKGGSYSPRPKACPQKITAGGSAAGDETSDGPGCRGKSGSVANASVLILMRCPC